MQPVRLVPRALEKLGSATPRLAITCHKGTNVLEAPVTPSRRSADPRARCHVHGYTIRWGRVVPPASVWWSVPGYSRGLGGKAAATGGKDQSRVGRQGGVSKRKAKDSVDGGDIQIAEDDEAAWLQVRDELKDEAARLGLGPTAVTTAEPSARLPQYEAWLEKNFHGEMSFLAREDRMQVRAPPMQHRSAPRRAADPAT